MPWQKWTDDEFFLYSLIQQPFQMQCPSRFRLREIKPLEIVLREILMSFKVFAIFFFGFVA